MFSFIINLLDCHINVLQLLEIFQIKYFIQEMYFKLKVVDINAQTVAPNYFGVNHGYLHFGQITKALCAYFSPRGK